MQSPKYLNVILTVIAFLLAGLLWTQVAENPLLDREAAAQRTNRSVRTTQTQPFPNAAEQRLKQRQLLEEWRSAFEQQRRFLESGRLQVEVTNLDEIQVEVIR